MRLLSRLILHIASISLAFSAANHFVAGFSFTGSFVELLLAAVLFTVVNATLGTVMRIILSPLIVLTLGLAMIGINAVVLYLLDIWIKPLTIGGYIPLLFATLVISALGMVISFAAKHEE